MSSTETPLRDGAGDYGYNVEAARAYHARGAVYPSSTMPQYSGDMSTGDMMSYRQGTYPYGGSTKGYYSGWGAGTYSEDGVDYGLNYQYPHLSQDPVHMVPGYRYGSSSKTSVYVDPEHPTYSYGNLVHRPAVSNDLPNFSLSGMAASLPTAERVSTASRTLSSSSAYRTDGLPGIYTSSKASASQSSDVGYGNLSSSYDAAYNTTATLPSSVSARSSQSDATGTYQSASSASGDGLYASDGSSYRGAHEADGYVYSDRFDSSRRDSQSSGGAGAGSVLSNGHVYVPESQAHSSSHSYSVASSHAGGPEGATTATGSKRGSSATSQTAGHRRSAGKVRGA